jgi:hypothetical protein
MTVIRRAACGPILLSHLVIPCCGAEHFHEKREDQVYDKLCDVYNSGIEHAAYTPDFLKTIY